MTDRYPITPDFRMPRPLREGDQAIIDGIEQVEPGERGDNVSSYISRVPARRHAGTFGEVVFGRIVTIPGTEDEPGQQNTVFVDVMPQYLLAGVDTRPHPDLRSMEQVHAISNSPTAQAIKLEAARRIGLANMSASAMEPKPCSLEITPLLFERWRGVIAVHLETFEEIMGADAIALGNILLNTKDPLTLAELSEEAGMPFVQTCDAFKTLNDLLRADGPLRLDARPDTEKGYHVFRIVPTEPPALEEAAV